MRTVSLCFVLLTGLIFTGNAQESEIKKIILLHTNDIHSHLTGWAPESDYSPLSVSDDNTVGGMARIAAIFEEERGKDDEITLIVDAGDFLMGTLFQGVELTTGFQLRLMEKMGYDAVTIGNHEFDYGPARLAEIISASVANGDIPDLVLSNAVFDDRVPDDDHLESLFDNGVIARRLILEKGGLKIGFFGIMGEMADKNAAFAPPVTFSDQIKVAREMTDQLKDEGCDLVIALSHSGLEKDKKGRLRGEDYQMAKKIKGLDLVISGHSHTTISEPLLVNGVAVVQTGAYGINVGRLEMSIIDGEVRVDSYKLIPVDDSVGGDEAVNELIEQQKGQIFKSILDPLGMEYDQKIVEAGFSLECSASAVTVGSNLGNLVADAIYDYVWKAGTEGTDIAMVAVGVIRDNIVPGIQTPPDIFRIMPMGMGNDNVPGYPLSRVYITGRELKNVIEVLLFSSTLTPENFCFYSGLKAEIDPEKGLMRKVGVIEIVNPDGTTRQVDTSKKSNMLYSISANSYLLASIGIISDMTYGLIKVEPKDSVGRIITDFSSATIDMDFEAPGIQEGKEWLALIEYLSSMADSDGNGIPEIDGRYW